MRWMIVLLAGCQWVYGVDKVESESDQPGDYISCSALKFDPLRYQSADAGSADGFDWHTARQNCNYIGFDLAVLDSGDDMEWLNERMGATAPFWLGVEYDTKWVAIDGCETRFDGPVPSTSTAGDCLAETTSGMLDVPCTFSTTTGGNIGALCEAPRPTRTCLDQQSQREYMAAGALPVTHAEALSACADLQMHLVEIDSSDELTDVQNMFPGAPFWVGATKTTTGWRSPTGCPEVFGWGQGEPTNADDCAYFDGALQSYPCFFPDPKGIAICEANH
jgi:hypothetical protein